MFVAIQGDKKHNDIHAAYYTDRNESLFKMNAFSLGGTLEFIIFMSSFVPLLRKKANQCVC
jgi:hypothetical protein